MSRPGPAAARAVALCLIGLRQLSGWEDADALAERTADSLRDGGEGLSRVDADRLVRWSSRWATLRPEIRVFYQRAIESQPTGTTRIAVSLGLLAILDGRRPEGWVVGSLRRLHVDLLAEETAFELCPARVLV